MSKRQASDGDAINSHEVADQAEEIVLAMLSDDEQGKGLPASQNCFSV
jgi:hypothetical protein